MREIKFRAWDSIGQALHPWNKVELVALCEFVDIEHYTLMQYTGLKDKNGVEIYDGDLLLVDNRRTVKVVYKNSIASFDTEYVDDTSLDYFKKLTNAEWTRRTEIIGNIHENPELLK